MKTSSAKAKGRNLQKYVRDEILKTYPSLTLNDVRSTSMGANGEDILLSEAARLLFPFSVECKSRAAFNVYTYYQQAQEVCKSAEPLLIIKANHKKPLVVLDAEYFIKNYRVKNVKE